MKPYYAVIFTSILSEKNSGYKAMATKMEALAKTQKGFLGLDTARDEKGITISYWESLEAIRNWKNNFEHLLAQKKGKDIWYKSYQVKICKVAREYSFTKKPSY